MNMDYSALGKYIRKYRHLADLTQERLAEAVGCSDRHIGKIENGQNVPSLAIVVSIAAALKVDVDKLIYGEQPERTDYFIQELVSLTETFAEKDKLMAIAMVKSLVSVLSEFNKMK
jgi:transcriptional regulator with XRE-family HTH domain